jgi:asparagine synthase (glutamine-hydrolysing)
VVGVVGGRQPITNEVGNITAVVNGEFYGWERSRANLQARGHVFTTQSDSELLVHLYEEHGLQCLQHLRGEFAFLLWDETKNRLFAACDRFGIRLLPVVQRGAEWLLPPRSKRSYRGKPMPCET